MGTKIKSIDQNFGIMNAIYLFLAVFFMCFAFSNKAYSEPSEISQADFESATPLFFSIQVESNNEKMARKALEDILPQHEQELGRYIPLGLARIDLNNDGIKELFVRILEPELFCDGYDCQVYGFAITQDGFVKIADLKTKGIDVLQNKTSGTRDILLLKNNGERQKLIWDNGFYKDFNSIDDQKADDNNE